MMKRNYLLAAVVAMIAVFGISKMGSTANAAENASFADIVGGLFGLQSAATTSFVPVPVSLPAVNAPTGATISVPITTGDLTGLGAAVYNLQVTYDPAIVTPASPAFDKTGTLSSPMLINSDTTNSGHLIISAFNTIPLTGSGTLIYLRFTVIGTLGQSTALTFEDYTDPTPIFHPGFRYNEGDPAVTITNGSVTIVNATATATNTPTALNTATSTNTATNTPTFTPTNTATATATGTPAVAVALPIMTASPATVVLVPITVGDTTGLGIMSYDLQVTFNPAIITPASPAFVKTGTVSSNMFVTPNTGNAGHMIISAFDVFPLTGSGTLLNLRFNVVGSAGQSTGLTFEDYTSPGSQFHPGFRFNGGSPPRVISNGSLTIATATPTATNTATFTATATFTPTATNTATFTPTATSTSTFTPTATSTSTFTPTATSTSTFTPTSTATSTFTPTATFTATFTPTFTPTVVPTPILGNYNNAVIPLSTNTTITPDAAPLLATSMNVSTSTNFKGKLEADPTTGVVIVTNAHPAGIHLITVTAFGFMGVTNTRTFTLTVNTPPVCNPVSFASAALFGAGTGSYSIAVGDFNRDNKQDLAVENSGSVGIWLGNGAGNFSFTTNFGVGSSPYSVAVGDFNGDGQQDLVAANPGSNSVSIFLGNGAGSFSVATNFAAGVGPISVAVTDFNGDHRQDLAVANLNTADVSILMGNGSGGFSSAVNFGADFGPQSVAVGDFNNDGKQDVAAAGLSGNVSILLGNGAGNFSPATNFVVGGHQYSVAVGDFNEDGSQDLAVTNDISPFGGASVLLGDGAGTFGAATNFNVGSAPSSIAVGDFNADGKQDLALGNWSLPAAGILLGNGLGGFSTVTNFLGTNSASIAVGDFNGDGKQDLATANATIQLRDCTISGSVVYGNFIGSPSTRYVSNVQVNAAGSPAASATTLAPGAGEGTYKLDLLGAGPYTVTPSKVGGVNNAINSFDAARIASHVAGLTFLTGNQFVAADVSGNNAIQSFDAAQIARFVTAQTPFGLTGTWRFFTIPNIPFPTGSTPTSRTYPTLTSNLAGEDFTAILLGDVSGNWNNTGARPGVAGRDARVPSGPERTISVELPDLAATVGKEIVVPVRVDNAADKGIVSYEFELRYDPSVIQPLEDVVDVAGTSSRSLSFSANANEPGILRVALYGAFPIDSNGLLLNLRFKAVGEPGAVSRLTWQRIMFNDGAPRISAVNGRVRL